jgi:hypothetical protein
MQAAGHRPHRRSGRYWGTAVALGPCAPFPRLIQKREAGKFTGGSRCARDLAQGAGEPDLLSFAPPALSLSVDIQQPGEIGERGTWWPKIRGHQGNGRLPAVRHLTRSVAWSKIRSRKQAIGPTRHRPSTATYAGTGQRQKNDPSRAAAPHPSTRSVRLIPEPYWRQA